MVGSTVRLLRLLWVTTVCASHIVSAQSKAKLTSVDPVRFTPDVLFATYSGDVTTAQSQFGTTGKWQVWRAEQADAPYVEVQVGAPLDFSAPNEIRIKLNDSTLTEKIMRCSFWTVQFTPDGQPSVSQTYAPPSVAECQTSPSAIGSAAQPAAKKPFLAPPGPSATPDISISGSFIAGGGTKPIYTFEVVAGLYAPNPIPSILNFSPGVTTTVEINQGKTSSDRTSFDPDSIVSAFSLQKFARAKKGNGTGLVGVEFDEAVPSGEFSRADPTSNIVFGSTAVFVFRPVRKAQSKTYATIFPVIGLEAGKNLNRPSIIAKVPVDLSHYDTILRGYAGMDAQFSVIDKTDATADAFTLNGSYRVRLPAFDEPFVQTKHQITTISQTTKARHWFEATADWAPWSFKYLSLTAKYQYGELPPLFKLVDHSVSLGISFKAVQRNKATRAVAP